jgi:hypothetical protein
MLAGTQQCFQLSTRLVAERRYALTRRPLQQAANLPLVVAETGTKIVQRMPSGP